MTFYKLWLHIEEFTTDTDEPGGEPVGDVGWPTLLCEAADEETAEAVAVLIADAAAKTWGFISNA